MRSAWLAIFLLQDTPEATYRAIEKKLVDAPAVLIQLKGEGTVTRGDRKVQSAFDGVLKVKPGNKAIFDLNLRQGAKEQHRVSRSDGKTTINEVDGVKSNPTPVQEGATGFMRECVLRSGFVPLTVAAGTVGGDMSGPSLPKPDDTVSMSDFTSPEKDVLEYKVKLFGKMEGKVKLWLSEGMPTRRTFTATHEGMEVSITETYEKISTEDIPDKDFDHE